MNGLFIVCLSVTPLPAEELYEKQRKKKIFFYYYYVCILRVNHLYLLKYKWHIIIFEHVCSLHDKLHTRLGLL